LALHISSSGTSHDQPMQQLQVRMQMYFLGWGETGSTWYRWPLFGLLYQPRMIDDECGVVGGMRIGRGNRSTGGKPAPVPLCPPQIPHDPTWTTAMGSRRLTA
jgi:hypothetical protein